MFDCILVDCWDGNTEPVVYHGRTLTSKILFSEVIETVNKNAFLASPYVYNIIQVSTMFLSNVIKSEPINLPYYYVLMCIH